MFSVVIPLYNKELSVRNTINSVLDQTFKEFEIVIVNDGSTDNSLEIVQQIKDDRIRIIDKANGGVSSARNRGIKEAKYEWIAFLDADDLWEGNHLITISKLIKRYPDINVFSTSYTYDKENIKSIEMQCEIIENYFLSALNNNFLWTSVVVVNKVCLEKEGGFNVNLSRGEDIDLWIRLAKNYKFVKTNIITGIYKKEAENRLCKQSLKYESSIVSVLDFDNISSKYEKEYKKVLVVERFKSFLYNLDLKSVFKILVKYNVNLFK